MQKLTHQQAKTEQVEDKGLFRQGRWESGLVLCGWIVFILLIFRAVLAPGNFLLTTDDNIGGIRLSQESFSVYRGLWQDTVILGMPSGVIALAWNAVMLKLLPTVFYINWMHAIDLGLAGLFLGLFLRRQGLGRAAVALACLTAFWLGSNFTLTYAGHIGKFGVLLMAALALYCIARALSERIDWPWLIIAGGAIGCMFLEQLDVALFFGLVLGAYALLLAVRVFLRDRSWVRPLVGLILMGAVALLICAPTMLASYAINVKGVAAMESESPQQKWDYCTQWSWPPEETIDFIAPGYMGWRSGEPAGPYWGRMGRSAGWENTRQGFMNFKLENQYLGAIPMLLAFFAVFWVLRARGNQTSPMSDLVSADKKTEVIFWASMASLTLLLAFGKFFPLYAWFYNLPMISSIRNPNKFLQVFQLAFGILAAHGLDLLQNGEKRELTNENNTYQAN